MSLTLKENMMLVYQHKVPEYLPLMEDIQTIRTVGNGLNITIADGTYIGGPEELDWFGQNWVYEPTIKAYNPDARNYIIKDVTKWRDYVTLPDVDAVDWEALFKKADIQLDRENKLVSVRDALGIWERAFAMINITDLLCALLVEPEACMDFFSTIADHKIKLHNYYIDYYKPDIFCMNDDYGGGNGLFMSPETWRQIIKPNLQKIIDNITSKGVMYEHHCCGNMVPIAEEIAEMGATSWNSVHNCNDPYECKQKFGDKIAFVGGMFDVWYMDAPSTTEEQIRAHVRERAAQMLPGVGVVMQGSFSSYPERLPVFWDEFLTCGQQYFKSNRPA